MSPFSLVVGKPLETILVARLPFSFLSWWSSTGGRHLFTISEPNC